SSWARSTPPRWRSSSCNSTTTTCPSSRAESAHRSATPQATSLAALLTSTLHDSFNSLAFARRSVKNNRGDQGSRMLIYPGIDLLNGRCVRLRQGDYPRETVFSDDPAEVARRWVAQGADRLHVVDLDGAKAGKPMNGPIIRKIVEAAGVPV